MTLASDTESRLARLEAVADLHALKLRYADAADAKYTMHRQRRPDAELKAAARRQADCFAHDARWAGGSFGGDIVGRPALFEFFCKSPWRFTAHYYLSPALQIDGDTARGQWRLWELGIREPDGKTVLVTGRTIETYRRDRAEGWLIASMAFEQLHSLVVADDPDALRCLIPGEDKR